MSSDFQQLENDKAFQRLVAEVRAGRRLVNVAGLSGSAKALALAALQQTTGKRLAIISQRSRDLEDLERDLRFFYCHLRDREECENEIFTLPACSLKMQLSITTNRPAFSARSAASLSPPRL